MFPPAPRKYFDGGVGISVIVFQEKPFFIDKDSSLLSKHSSITTMSSVAGIPLHSDNLFSDPATARRNRTSRASNNRLAGPRSSPRPHGPPSESNGALSDAEGFPDDDVVGIRGTDRNRPRDPMAQAIPKVVDRVGEKVAEEFENFLDQYSHHSGKLNAFPFFARKLFMNYGLDMSTTSFRLLELHHRVR